MSKDPAVLFYISDWLTSTKEMRADERGWYLNLILHQYDKGDLPNNVEELANLADVRFSEFDNFKQRWEQVLKQKFEENKNGRLENSKAKKILQGRAQFKEKRSNSGRIGYVIKFAKSNICNENEYIEYIKKNFDFENTTINDKQVLKQVLKHLLKLYRNENENENVNKDAIKNVIEYLNEQANKNFSPDSQATKEHLNARIKEGRKYEDFIHIIDIKVNQWKGDPKMDGYLRPQTLFAPKKFESYLNEKIQPKKGFNEQTDIPL